MEKKKPTSGSSGGDDNTIDFNADDKNAPTHHHQDFNAELKDLRAQMRGLRDENLRLEQLTTTQERRLQMYRRRGGKAQLYTNNEALHGQNQVLLHTMAKYDAQRARMRKIIRAIMRAVENLRELDLKAEDPLKPPPEKSNGKTHSQDKTISSKVGLRAAGQRRRPQGRRLRLIPNPRQKPRPQRPGT